MDPYYCAIYTRKSTSEGLEGDFTSLDSQRESALNYIASQKSQGWVALPEEYDDGGFTGANMDRPALQKLLEDIKSGRINCIVVYKVDRLSRSLMDFAKLLEFFDNHNVTFVAVTQSFNTNTSMGRLTLNILLSFAQFERELISERTKDKVGAARRKGRWLGGMPMLGYDRDKEAKALVVNEEEAKIVRLIFELYLQKQSTLEVAKELNARGVRTKRHIYKDRTCGDRPFVKKSVGDIINNYTYIGKVKYAGEVYDGVHKGIVSPHVFARAQKIMGENHVHRGTIKNTKGTTLLKHILWCGHCKTRMVPTYAAKKNIKYRYYVCYKAQSTGYESCPVRSVNAQFMENFVVEKVGAIINQTPEWKGKNLIINTPAWDVLYPQERRRVLNLLVRAIVYEHDAKKISIEFNSEGIEELQKELADAL